METVRVEILNPNAKKLLNDLADMEIISIEKDAAKSFIKLLKKLRLKSGKTPSLTEITKEVEAVRSKRHG